MILILLFLMAQKPLYGSVLPTDVPLTSSESSRACGQADAEYWRAQSAKLISPYGTGFQNFRNLPMSGANNIKEEFEKGILLNSLISLAYARLSLLHGDVLNDSGDHFFYWMPSAPHVSLAVGRIMRGALVEFYGSERFPILTEGFQNLELESVAANDLAVEISRRLKRGNLAIFKDLFWQHLAAVVCGPGEVIRLLNGLISSDKSRVRRLHLESLRRGWDQIVVGSNAFNRNQTEPGIG